MTRLDGAFWRRFHMVWTVIWILAIIPTMIWWRDSVFWVCLMSLWANIASHAAAYQAARVEESNSP